MIRHYGTLIAVALVLAMAAAPAESRFLQNDPIGMADDANLYAYVANDPLNETDPTGQCPMCLPVLIFVAKEAAGEAFEQTTGLPAPTVKGVAKQVGKRIGKAATEKAGKQMAENAAKGKAGEAATRSKLGDKVAGEQVTFKTTDGSRTRSDFVTTEKGVVETKTGGAQLSSGQKKLKDDIDAGREVTPVGQNASKAGLEPGKPTKMESCVTDRPC